MSKASWKKWPEFQYRFAADEDEIIHVHVRTYTEAGETLTPYHADLILDKTHLSDSCREELKGKLASRIPK